MEESCWYRLNQERDSITGICLSVPQSEGNPLQTPTDRKTNRACVFHINKWTAWHSGVDTITRIHPEKAELTIFIPQLYLPLNMRSSWYSQMDQPDGFLLTQWNLKTTLRQDLESKCLCHVSDFLWADGNISSPVHWWERNICRIHRHLRPKRMAHRNIFRD